MFWFISTMDEKLAINCSFMFKVIYGDKAEKDEGVVIC